MADPEELRLAFIDVIVFPDGSIRGGILTTDMETKPFEFRITSPIKPTQIQQILYGSSLKDHVYSELICVPLIRATKEKISLVLIKDNYLMSVRPHVSVPVILLHSSGPHAGDEIKPINLASHRNFPSESTYAQTVLAPILQHHDLLEPFERLKLALGEVHKARLGEDIKRG